MESRSVQSRTKYRGSRRADPDHPPTSTGADVHDHDRCATINHDDQPSNHDDDNDRSIRYDDDCRASDHDDDRSIRDHNDCGDSSEHRPGYRTTHNDGSPDDNHGSTTDHRATTNNSYDYSASPTPHDRATSTPSDHDDNSSPDNHANTAPVLLMSTTRRTPIRPRRGCGRRNERGASVVEAALVAPLFFLLIFGIVEGGAFFFNINSVRNSARDGAREASTWASDALADRNALAIANRGLTGAGSRLDGVIIFKAVGPNDRVPPACVAALNAASNGVTGLCNVYTATKMRTLDDTRFGAQTSSPPGLWDEAWPPTGRQDALTPTETPDFVGMYVRIRHIGVSGILPNRTISGTSISRIEPQRASE